MIKMSTLVDPPRIDSPQYIDIGDHIVTVGSVVGGCYLVRPGDQIRRMPTPVHPEFTGRWKTVVQGGRHCDLYMEVVLSAWACYKALRFLRSPEVVKHHYAVTMWAHENMITVTKKDVETINECGCKP